MIAGSAGIPRAALDIDRVVTDDDEVTDDPAIPEALARMLAARERTRDFGRELIGLSGDPKHSVRAHDGQDLA